MKRLLLTLALVFIATPVFAGALLPYPNFKAIDGNGNPIRGGKLYTYAAGTSDNKTAWKDEACSVAQENPIVLSSEGETTIFLCGEYKLNLKTSNDGQVPKWPVDNVWGMANAATLCDGTYTYLDGDGNCDDFGNFVATCSDGDVLGTDCGTALDLTNGFIVHIASGTVVLPAAGSGVAFNGCVKATTAAVIHIDPDDNDRWVLDGVALDDGDKLTSPGLLDDTVCFYVDSTSGWTTIHNPDSLFDGS